MGASLGVAALEHDPYLKLIPVIIFTSRSHLKDIGRCSEF